MLVTAGLLVALYPNVLFWVIQRPVVDWDARSIWLFHAKVLAVDQGLDPAFFTDPVYLHPSYPLLVPAQAAWLSLLRGGWSEMAGKSFLLLNFAAYLQLFLALLRVKGHPWWLGLGAALLFFDTGVRSYGDGFGYAYVNGYADAHFIAPFLLALLAFSLPRSQKGPALGALLATGLVTGMFAVSGVALACVARRSPARLPAVSLVGAVVRMVAYGALLTALAGADSIDRTSTVVTTCVLLATTLAYEVRFAATTPGFYWIHTPAPHGAQAKERTGG